MSKPRAFIPLPPLYRVLAALKYDPETGELFTRYRTAKRPAGSRADYKASGTQTKRGEKWSYRYVVLFGAQYKAHRVAWMLWHGYDPGPMIVDHINGDCADNRACNLRLATHAQNTWNQAQRECLSGKTGVKRKGDKWVARINIGGERIHLGTFDSFDAAASAYDASANEHRREFLRKGIGAE